jgi:hypothetical protein
MIPGDIIYIESQTGNGKHSSPDLFIQGRYEFVREDETYIWIKDEHTFRIRKDKITKIE